MLRVRFTENGRRVSRFARLIRDTENMLIFARLTSKGEPWPSTSPLASTFLLRPGEVEMTPLVQDRCWHVWVPEAELSAGHREIVRGDRR